MKTKPNFARFYQLLAQMQGADKEELVWQSSNMLTTSLREFCEKNPKGYQKMLDDMQKSLTSGNDTELRRLRSAVLHRMQKYGIDTSNWGVVNSFLSNPRIAGKRLWEMSIEELHILIPKLQMLIAKKTKEQRELNRLQMLN